MRAAFVSAALAFASVVFVPCMVHADEGAHAEEPASAVEVRGARAEIEATVAQMGSVALRVRDQLRAARRRGKKSQIACVDEALSRADVAVRRARTAGDEALAAYGRSDVPAARDSLRLLREIKESQRIAAEGVKCAAPPPRVARAAIVPNVTTVKLEIDPKIPSAP
jgi:hypothetical protein